MKITSDYTRGTEKALQMSIKHGKQFGMYLCPHCDHHHLTTKLDNAKKYEELVYITPTKTMSTEIILNSAADELIISNAVDSMTDLVVHSSKSRKYFDETSKTKEDKEDYRSYLAGYFKRELRKMIKEI
jgi:hypothetical protein